MGLICGQFSQHNTIKCGYDGTSGYMSPYASRNFTKNITIEDAQKEDIWSWAITLFVLLEGSLPPHIDESQEKIYKLIDRLQSVLIKRNTPHINIIAELLRRSLILDLDQRHSISELLDFFDNEVGEIAELETQLLITRIIGI